MKLNIDIKNKKGSLDSDVEKLVEFTKSIQHKEDYEDNEIDEQKQRRSVENTLINLCKYSNVTSSKTVEELLKDQSIFHYNNIRKIILEKRPNISQRLEEKPNESIENNIENEIDTQQKQNESSTKKIEVTKNNSTKNDYTIDEMSALSIKDLEKLLESKQEENKTKKEELENLIKRKLIAKIKEEIDKGKELDSEIAEAKANTIVQGE